MKIIDIAKKHLGQEEATRLFNPPKPSQTYAFWGPAWGQAAVEANRPSAAFNLLVACKDTELEELHGDELRTMMRHLLGRNSSYPELKDDKYKPMLSDMNNEVFNAWSKVRHKWVTLS